MGSAFRGMWLGVAIACSACWTSHRDDSAEPRTAAPVAGTCAAESCGAPSPPSRPPFPAAAPARCRDLTPAANPGDSLCRAGELSVHCVNAPPRVPCPATYLEAAIEACREGVESYRIACNACGGVSVEVVGPFYAVDVHYDPADELAGVTLTHSSPVGPCEQEEFVFGRHCTASEQRETLSCSALQRLVQTVVD